MHGVSFNNLHSYVDLHLLPQKISIPPARVKTNYVDLPGGNGSVDLTEALGEAKFEDRECEFVFAVFPGDNFERKKQEVSNALNGLRCQIRVDKQPGYYYDGRCEVNEYASDRNIHTIAVKAVVRPYKLRNDETKVICPLGDSVEICLFNRRMRVVPTITNTEDASITFKGKTYELEAGTHRVMNIELVQGKNEITVTSTAEVLFTYREGDL